MYGDQLPPLLEDFVIMSLSFMIIVNSLGSIYLSISLMRSTNFMIFSSLLSDSLVKRSLSFKRIGGEYQKLTPFFQCVGISHHVSCPHTHQQNGFAERKHHHTVEVGLSLLAHSSMPLKFWDEAFSTAAYLINRLPSRVIGFLSSFEKLFNSKPDYTWLKVFGCACGPHLRPYNSRKLEFQSKKCVFLGYSLCHKGYKCLDVAIGHVYMSHDVVFDENDFMFSQLLPNTGSQLRAEIFLLPSTLRNSHEHDLVGDHRTNGVNLVVEHGIVQADEVTPGGFQEEFQSGKESGIVVENTMDPVATSDPASISALDPEQISRLASSLDRASLSILRRYVAAHLQHPGVCPYATHGSTRLFPVLSPHPVLQDLLRGVDLKHILHCKMLHLCQIMTKGLLL
jgi:hypothetical protein